MDASTPSRSQVEFGNDTWENGSWATNGNTGVWTQITDRRRTWSGVSASRRHRPSDEYGGHRPGDNLFGGITCGRRFKNRQARVALSSSCTIRYGISIISAAPLLIDMRGLNGKARSSLYLFRRSKGWLYTFDRVTGKPIWPMPENAGAAKSDIPDEKTSPTQPIPSMPPALFAQRMWPPSDIIDFTPELHAKALENLKKFRLGASPDPWLHAGHDHQGQKYLGSINIANTSGGVNWPGSGFDPETGIFYTQAGNSAVTVGSDTALEEFEKVRPETQAKMSPHGRNSVRWEAEGPENSAGLPTRRRPRGDPALAPGAFPARPPTRPRASTGSTGLDGLPIVKPPYGVLVAIDMNTGTMKFQVPHGDTPDNVRNHPLLKGMNIPKTGQSGSVGVLITKTWWSSRQILRSTATTGAATRRNAARV